ncbi:MAG: hypothetical protein QN157_12105 [Armatimonadota bacterium]|nr:hypothetical protein [Armatimonadota bacterium]
MQLTDRHGRPITPGARVRVAGLEGIVNRLEPQYGVFTIVIEERTGKKERMVRAADAEVLAAETAG